MPTFELKPMGTTNNKHVGMGAMLSRGGHAMAAAIPTIDDVVWTAERSVVPPQFAGRIPAEVWASTFDALRTRYAADLETAREGIKSFGGGLPMIPCCVPCIIIAGGSRMGELQQRAHEMEQAWLTLVQSEQAKYQPYGGARSLCNSCRAVYPNGSRGSRQSIDVLLASPQLPSIARSSSLAVSVTVATELQASGTGSSRNIYPRKVGLRFEAAEMVVAPGDVAVVAAAVVPAVPYAQPMERGPGLLARSGRARASHLPAKPRASGQP